MRYRSPDGRNRGERAPNPQTWRGAGESSARMCALVAAFFVESVGAVHHGFYEVELCRKENLTRYTPYLARQLTMGEYR